MSNDENKVRARIHELFYKQIGEREPAIEDSDHICNDLGLDAFDQVELLMAIEEAFEIEIADETAEQWQTVREVVSYVEQVKQS